MRKVFTVRLDEPVWRLTEQDMVVAGKPRRMQGIVVIRDDEFALHTRDLGPATGGLPFVILSALEDSVAFVRAEADRMRDDDTAAKRQAELQAGSTLIEDFLIQAEKLWKARTRGPQTISGPALTVRR